MAQRIKVLVVCGTGAAAWLVNRRGREVPSADLAPTPQEVGS